MKHAIINGELIPLDEARLSVNDLAIQRGYGIFDFFKTVNGNPIWLDDHLDRLYFSASEMLLPVLYHKEEIKGMIRDLMLANNLPDSGIRITLTGGDSEDGYTPGTPNLIITQKPFRYNPESFEKGVRLVTYEHQRQLPQVKTIDYLQAIRLQKYIRNHNADDLLYYHQSKVLESPRSNIFMVNEAGELLTPVRNILYGITRKKILALSSINVQEAFIHTDNLFHYKEIFLASTTKIVLPVLQINGQPVGDGNPGPVSRKIHRQLLDMQGLGEGAGNGQ